METPKPLDIPNTISFGTYRLDPATAAARVRAALALGFRRIDTARLYRNEDAVFEAVREYERAKPERPVIVTSKLYDDLRYEPAIETVARSAQRLGRPIDVMLLHRALPPIAWRALDACVEAGHVREIGVSNHSVAQLEAVLSRCGAVLRPPTIAQVEVHPFVGPLQPFLSYCRARGVRVQGHTMLARGELFDAEPLPALADRYGASPATIMLRWAHQLGVELLVSSSRDDHLREAIEDVASIGPISAGDMATLNGLYAIESRRFFVNQPAPRSIAALDDVTCSQAYVDGVVARLSADMIAVRDGAPISSTALELPTRTNKQLLTDPIANRIAHALFPDYEGRAAYARYRALVRDLRSRVVAARQGQPKAKRSQCSVPVEHPAYTPRTVAGVAVSAAIAMPQPMPVEVAPLSELAPFFEFLEEPTERSEWPSTFVRGTYFPDQRMDLCKQVVGPDHVEALCAAVGTQAQHGSAAANRVRHFLLGNNIACDGASTRGAEAFAQLMADPAAEIETWYLAGNCVDGRDLEVMVPALIGNRHAKALWLKRNPIGVRGAAALGELLGRNSVLELLDLHNVGLFDEGVEAMTHAFARTSGPLHLHHLYLSANALSARSVHALARMVHGVLPSSLESLYLSINRLGNDGLNALVSLVRTGSLRGLRRLDIGAMGLHRPDLNALVDALCESCPELIYLCLGTYKATRDLGERANALDPDVAPLVRLLREHPSVRLLDVSLTGLPEESVDRLVEGLSSDQSLEGVGDRALHHSHDERRVIRHPARVVHIDSVYRGRA